jgi:hypothetical protein
MILRQPRIIEQENHTILGTRIQTLKPRLNFPEYLWYRVPKEYGAYLSTQNDAFLAPALLAGMYYGESLQVQGAVSPRLAYNLDEYQYIISIRFPDLLQRVSLQFERIEASNGQPRGIGAAFSGGLDSLFTLWKHLPNNQSDPDYQITHGIFIKGFDILPKEGDDYDLLYNQYSQGLARYGVELIPVETNMVSITHQRMPFPFIFGPIIVSAGISLQGLLRSYFIPSSWDHHKLMKESYSSDPGVDSLLSTDQIRIIHHGATHRRVEKTEEIAAWDLSQELLWVCTEAAFEGSTWNCSRCEKCVRAMIPLYALGEMGKYKTFSKPFESDRDVLWWARRFSLRQNYVSELFPFVRKHKPALLPWMRLAAIVGYLRYLLVKYMPQSIKNWLRRYGYFLTRNEAPDAYEVPEITEILKKKECRPKNPIAQ